MSIVQLNPWRPFESLHGHFNGRLNTARWPHFDSREWRPALDIVENDENYVISVDVPGVATDDIDITLDDGMLTIKGSRKIENRSSEEAGKFRSYERISGSFRRTVRLPEKVNGDEVSAVAKDGILTVTVTKPAEIMPQRIEVQA